MTEFTERLSEALWNHDMKTVKPAKWRSWLAATVREQEKYRDRVDAVLRAALDPTEDMAACTTQYAGPIGNAYTWHKMMRKGIGL